MRVLRVAAAFRRGGCLKLVAALRSAPTLLCLVEKPTINSGSESIVAANAFFIRGGDRNRSWGNLMKKFRDFKRIVVEIGLIVQISIPVSAAMRQYGTTIRSEEGGKREDKKNCTTYSKREVLLGIQMASAFESASKMVEDPEVNEYLDKLAYRLAEVSRLCSTVQVRIIESKEINGRAIPSGHLYLTTGLISSAESESELAGVMAHEIAHLAEKTWSQDRVKARLVIPLGIATGGVGYIAYQGIERAVTGGDHRRVKANKEIVADCLGLEYLSKAGFDPNAYLAYLLKLEKLEPVREGRSFTDVSTHPPLSVRIERIQEKLGCLLYTQEQPTPRADEFDKMKKNLLRARRSEADRSF